MSTKPTKAKKQREPSSEEDEILAMMSQEDEGGSHREFSEIEIDLDNPDNSLVLIDEDMSDEEYEDKNTPKDEDFELEGEDTEEEEETPPKKDTAKKEVSVKEEAVKEAESEDVKAQKSRAQERIRELARQKDEAIKEANEAKARELNLQLGYAKQMSARYTNDISIFEKQLKEAMQENDADAFIAAQKSLNEAQASKMQLDKFLEDAPKQATKQTTPQERITSKDVQDKDNLPEVARNWLEMKADYLDPEKYKALPLDVRKKVLPIRQDTFKISNELRAEGYSPEDSSFYEELDLRLSLKHDIYDDLALLGLDVLDSNTEDTKKSSSSGETLKPIEKAKKTTLPVSASVGSTSSSKSSKKGPLRVSITAEQKQFYNDYLKHRMSFNDYVKQIALDKQQYPDD
jgi:hypothetical protein